MRILISVDIEGVAGVFHAEQTRAGNTEYERARRLMTAEANAAIRGAFAGGATSVLVNDSHGGFRNLLPDVLDPRAQAVWGKPRVLGMMGGLEQGCDGVFMVGYHARSQSRGVLAHTINSFAFARIWLNDQELGEAGLYGALAAELGVPVLLASGDDVFQAETAPLFPRARFVVTKTAQGHASGVSLSPEAACAAIEAAAREVLAQALPVPQPAALPARCRLQTQSPGLADLFAVLPGVERLDGVTLGFGGPTVQDVVRTLNSLSAMSAMLR
ncbi:D-amino peptidase [Rhodoferax ferrireducens]|uniref:D-amino peptidase n=1 Tax=Rhodoferax ferrireducens TaxID=192843 RepID=A0ABU2C4R5_9BURK|nr:M55 family metallopeptidase [Rhodoferax ferrireducens]MDR7376323.1 D-amino peptidase [Rhodoferax ferrireducens]